MASLVYKAKMADLLKYDVLVEHVGDDALVADLDVLQTCHLTCTFLGIFLTFP